MTSYGGGLLQASIASPWPFENDDKWRFGNEPMRDSISPMLFRVFPKAPHPDFYMTGCVVDVCSARFVEILERFDVDFEAVPVQFVDSKKRPILSDLHYSAVRIMQRLRYATPVFRPGIGGILDDIAVDPKALVTAPPAFYDTRYLKVFFREDLKTALENAAVTGIRFQTLQEKLKEELENPIRLFIIAQTEGSSGAPHL